jgi:Fe-S cluster assembly protein SufD
MTHPSQLVDRLGTAGTDGRTAARARAWLLEHGLPDPHDERWRATPLDRIADALADAAPAPRRPLDLAEIDRLAGRHDAIRIVFVNGRFAPGLSDRRPLGPGLWCGAGTELPGPDANRYELVQDDPRDAFHALNLAGSDDVAIVLADRDTTPARPVHVVHVSVGDAPPGSTGRTSPGRMDAGPDAGSIAIAHPRTIIHANARSDVEVIETFTGTGAAITNAETTIRLGADAAVRHHRVQTESTDALHLGHTAVHLARDARLRSTSIMVGGRIARHGMDTRLYGPRAHAELTGLHHVTGARRHVSELTVEHASSDGTTSQSYVGIVGGRARSSFGGHVIIREGTVGNDTHQLSRNLLLSPTARADARPWLEIDADDVRCTHGATVGRLDDDALFYLRSRGVPERTARAVLVDAFARQVLDPIEPRSLRDHLTGLLAAAATP